MGNCLISRQVYGLNGHKLIHKKNYSSNGLGPSEFNARLGDKYFKETNKFPFSPGMIAALIEIVGATALVKCFPTYAAKVNWLTTVGETGSVLLAGSDNLPKAVRDGGLAWFQIGSGMFGLGGFIKETFLKDDDEDFSNVSTFNKIALSSASLLNVFSMASGAIEKSLLSMVCWNTDDRKRDESAYRSSLTSALSDRRCITEWIIMTVVPWVSDVGFIRKFLDAFIPYQAVREGVDVFMDDPDTTLIFSKKFSKSKGFQTFLKVVQNPFSIFQSEDKKTAKSQEKYTLCWPFKGLTKFLIGTKSDDGGAGSSGFRNTVLSKVFKFLGCKYVPSYYLDKNNRIVAEFKGSPKDAERDVHYDMAV